jgi:sugar O-acyltransferase (sialic acid O-acetyltransferase NeuD family)
VNELPRELAVIGAGGHAKVVVATLQAMGDAPAVVLDDDEARWGGELLGVPVSGPVARLADGPWTRAVLAVGDNRTRQRLARRLAGPRLEWATAVHPAAVIDPGVEIAPGAIVFAGAVVQPGTRLGAHAIVNTAATVDHDGAIGGFVHLAPGVHLAGNVTVGEGAFLGVGAAVVPGRTVGAWATVGAGAVVVRDVPEGATVAGVAARTLPSRRPPEQTV